MILPPGERTGADTEATPCSRSPTDCAQPRRRMPGQRGGGEGGVLQAALHPLGVLPGEQHLGGRAGVHGQLGADRDGVAQAGGPLGGGDADPVVALAAPQLGGLAGDVAQPGQHRPGGGQQPVLARGGGQLGEPGPEHEPALHVAGDEPVVLERDREPVGGRSGQAGAGDQAGERRRAGLQGREHEGGLVEDADSAGDVVHMAILPSRIVDARR